MKKIFKYIFVVLLGSFLMTACQQEELPPIAEASISNITIEPSYTSAVITCDVESNVTIEANMVHLSKSPDFSNCQQYCLNQLLEGSFSDTISGLEDDMTYYVRYGIYNSWSAIEFDTVSVFKTLKGSIPTVYTSKVDMVTLNSAIVYGQVVEDGGFPITEYGFCYSTSPSPTIEDVKLICENSVISFSYNIVNLQEGTKYYIRSYAVYEDILGKEHIVYGTVKDFTYFTLHLVK